MGDDRQTEGFLDGFRSPPPGEHWPSTHWTLVRKANEGTEAERKICMEQIVLRYYKPIFRFFGKVLRARGARLEDVTQEFFARLIEKEFLKGVRYQKSFRGFLKVVCRRHYINYCEAERVRRPRRGKAVRPYDSRGRAIDIPLSEADFGSLFDIEMREAFLEQAVSGLREELLAAKKQTHLKVFEARVRFEGERPTDYRTLSETLGISIYSVRNHLTAVRRIFRRILLEFAIEASEDPREELRELDLLKYVS